MKLHPVNIFLDLLYLFWHLQCEEDGQMFFSLDDGTTKFTDLIQLVEFYQLNRGVLPCKLKHPCTMVTLWPCPPSHPANRPLVLWESDYFWPGLNDEQVTCCPPARSLQAFLYDLQRNCEHQQGRDEAIEKDLGCLDPLVNSNASSSYSHHGVLFDDLNILFCIRSDSQSVHCYGKISRTCRWWKMDALHLVWVWL